MQKSELQTRALADKAVPCTWPFACCQRPSWHPNGTL